MRECVCERGSVCERKREKSVFEREREETIVSPHSRASKTL